ncbi:MULTISPECIES: hypothetical protein [unclassified Chryseobacterium]|uniref:YncE family protein n=1 Tax=unclassified Chryseobacterium TaxID=2593645 RepID=UPI00226AA127|nr:MULTISPECIES: hypothetical protein [unclassified Chryseobacterium]
MDSKTVFLNACQAIDNQLEGFKIYEKGQRLKKVACDKDIFFEITFQSYWIQTLVPVGKGAEGFDVSSNGKELWMAKPDGHIAIVDLEKREIISEIDTKVLGLHRLKFTPDGKYICIVSVKTGELLFYDSKTRIEVKKINAGQGAEMLMDKEKKRLFMSCTPNNSVSVIDLKSMEVIQKLDIGGRPDGLTIAEVQ